MNEVSERLKTRDYPERISLAFAAARELGFTPIEQASLLGYPIEDPKDFINVRTRIGTLRNIDTERRAEFLIDVAAQLDAAFPTKELRIEWLINEQIPVASGASPRKLLLSEKPAERDFVVRALRHITGN